MNRARCRAHNRFEAEIDFGPQSASDDLRPTRVVGAWGSPPGTMSDGVYSFPRVIVRHET